MLVVLRWDVTILNFCLNFVKCMDQLEKSILKVFMHAENRTSLSIFNKSHSNIIENTPLLHVWNHLSDWHASQQFFCIKVSKSEHVFSWIKSGNNTDSASKRCKKFYCCLLCCCFCCCCYCCCCNLKIQPYLNQIILT